MSTNLENIRETFWKQVDKSDTGWNPYGCWHWMGNLLPTGYGRFNIGERLVYPHRFSYEELEGHIAEGQDLDHICRNRACVNPDHLEPVTRRENLLRGDTITARNAAKTHCPQGHELTTDNLDKAHLKNGQRRCRLCQNESNRLSKKRKADQLSF